MSLYEPPIRTIMNAVKQTLLLLTILLGVVAGACSAIEQRIEGLEFEVDIDGVLDEVRDCDRLSARFIGVIRSAADAIDELSAANEGTVPATDIRETVDRIAVSRFYDIAEQLGCTRLQFQADMLDRLRELDPESAAADDLLEQLEGQLQQQP
jgi:hypothetical protein